MSNAYRDKLLSIGYLGRGRTRDRVREGRSHPETGRAWKATSNEAGTIIEHNTADDRVDAVAMPKTVTARLQNGRLTNA